MNIFRTVAAPRGVYFMAVSTLLVIERVVNVHLEACWCETDQTDKSAWLIFYSLNTVSMMSTPYFVFSS